VIQAEWVRYWNYCKVDKHGMVRTVCFCKIRKRLFFKTSKLFLFRLSMKKHAIVNIFTSSKVFTIHAGSNRWCHGSSHIVRSVSAHSRYFHAPLPTVVSPMITCQLYIDVVFAKSVQTIPCATLLKRYVLRKLFVNLHMAIDSCCNSCDYWLPVYKCC